MPIIYNPPRLLVPTRGYAPKFLWAVGARGATAWTDLTRTERAADYVLGPSSAGLATRISAADAHAESWAGLKTSDDAGAGDFTFLVLANPAAGTRNALIAQGYNDIHFAIYANTAADWAEQSGTLSAIGYYAGTFRNAVSTSKIDGQWHVFACRRSGMSISIWRDGENLATSTGTAQNYWNVNSRLGIGSLWQGGTPSYFGSAATQYQLAAGWNRALSDAELALLGRNPWLLFEPQRRRIWVAASGGATSVSVDLTGIGATSAAGTVTATGAASSALTGAEATSSAGTTAVTVSIAATLVGASGTSYPGTLVATGAAAVTLAAIAATAAAGAATVDTSLRVDLSGAEGTAGAGTITVSGKAVATLAGAGSTAAAGDVTAGSVTPVALAGIGATAEAGTATVTGAAIVALAGVGATGSANALTITGGDVLLVDLTGAGATAAAGDVIGWPGLVPRTRYRITAYVESRLLRVG